jgi:hypothetical protein
MNPKAQITVSLCIAAPNSIDLATISLITGVEPTRIWRQSNAKIAATHPNLDYQEWRLEIERHPAADFDAAIIAILDLVWGSSDKLLRFCRSSNAVVSVHLSPHAGPDVIVFAIDDPITIKRLAFLESKLHFHLDRM